MSFGKSYRLWERLYHSKELSHTSLLSIPPLLLLLLSHFSRVRLCMTPEMAAHQAPPSLGFSRQEHWSGLPFPSPMRESEAAQSCPTLSHPMDCSPPGSSVHGIFQVRVLEWGAIAFSSIPPLLLGKHWSVSCPCSVAFYEMLYKWNHIVGNFIYKFFHSA